MNNKSMNRNNTTTDTIQEQDDFVDCVKTQLDNSEQQLPAHIVSRLRQSRRRVLDQTARKRARFDFSVLARHPWVASCASVLAVAMVVGYVQVQPLSNDDKIKTMDAEAEVLFADEDLELYEDLEFYRWLANTGY